ncbi:MAG: glycine betaine ABC transporter substrate-binding protein [Lachnospirales bacterium]
MKKFYLILISMFIFLTGCSENKNTISLALKPMTEQLIIGSMFKQMIENNSNIKVDITEGVGGGTLNIHPALVKGDFDIYPEYTGTSWSTVLKEEGIYTEENFNVLKEKYKDIGLLWEGKLGFNNTFGIAVRSEIADKYDIETFSDLEKLNGELVFGGEYDFFERDDGYNLLCETYNLEFKNTMDLDIGLKYDAILKGEVDVINIFTTDGRLADENFTVLDDDLNLYPSYMCCFIIRDEVYEKYPEVQSVLNILENCINEEEMANLNNKVEVLGMDYDDVAKEFLISKALIN